MAAVPASGQVDANNVSAGVGRLATWSKWTYAAKGYQTTLDPSTQQDGGPDLGPKWSKVVRRITYDMHNGKVIDDVRPKGMSLDDLTGPVRNTKANGRDIITEFHFRRGSWHPRDGKVENDSHDDSLSDVNAVAHAPACGTTVGKDCTSKCDEFVVPDDVLRTQFAMGCPLYPPGAGVTGTAIGKMPCLPPDVASLLEPQHREKNPMCTPLPLNAMVARPVGCKERDASPEALAVVAKE